MKQQMVNDKSIISQTIVVILAAGKGTRMGQADMAKVCFEIDSIPAINRTIAAFKHNRFNRFLLVTGSKSQQVLDTVAADNSGIVYVYQANQLGTGHAARTAADALQQIGYKGNVLITMGDKFIEPAAIQTLVDGFIKQQADMALITIPKTEITEASSGRVLKDSAGQVIDIIEKIDLSRQNVADDLAKMITRKKKITAKDISETINRHIHNTKKHKTVLPELAALQKEQGQISKGKLQKILRAKKYNLEIRGKRYSAGQIEKICKTVNPSLYLFKADAFYKGVAMIDNKNAAGEYYLTDIVKHLVASAGHDRPQYRVRAVTADNPDWIQGFNSPDELLGIQDYVRRKKSQKLSSDRISKPMLKPNQYQSVNRWLTKIDDKKSPLRRWLKGIYGEHESLHEQKSADLVGVLNCYGEKFGFDQKVCIVRAPGRINLMGRHVDHRGGFNNFLAIDRETMAVVGLRKDNDVVAVNYEPRNFKSVKFNISEMIGEFAWSDWINFVNSNWVRDILYNTGGNWENYIKAAVLRLQHQYQDVKVQGLNLAIRGNVPIAAGLSSSSTIVVATLQAAIALNNFHLTSQQFIDLCGQGEWFVGSRGGAGDHAAISLGQRGKIAHVGYMPFRVEEIINAPEDYKLVIANSHVKAAKSSEAKHLFNARITSYNLGLALLKQRCPEFTGVIEYLRDIDPEKLNCTPSDIYRMLLKVPRFMSRNDFRKMLSAEHKDLMDTNFASHSAPKYYHVRGVLLYGIAEIMRSKICPNYLKNGQIAELGTMMRISHDGDRVSSKGSDEKYYTIKDPYDDDYLNSLIADLASEDPERVLNAQLYMQPGGYACSTVEIDRMIDIACAVEGVAGAQIAGAGLGGCIMILARRDCLDKVQQALTKYYYKPNKLKPAILNCVTTEGAGLAEF